VELGTAGVTSPGDFPENGFAPPVVRQLDAAVASHNSEVVWTDSLHQGYVRLVLRHGGGQADMVAVRRIDRPDPVTSAIRRFALVRGDGTVALRPI